MKRRVNLRFLAYVLGASAVLAVSGYFLHAFQVQRNAGALLRRAERERTEGQYAEAIQSFRRYLQLVPNDGNALADYGLTLDDADKKTRRSGPTYDVLEKALRLSPNRDDARRRIVEVALDRYQFSDARYHVEQLLNGSKNNAELEDLLGRCYEGDRQYSEARKQYEQAIDHAPKRVESYVHLVDLYRQRLGKANLTDKLMQELLKNNQEVPARVALARYYRTGGSGLTRDQDALARKLLGAYTVTGQVARIWFGTDLLFDAEQQMSAARALDPDDAEVLLESAEVARADNRLDQAEGYAKAGLQRYPKDIRMYKQVAELALRKGKSDEAIKVLESGIELLPDEVDLTFLLADLLISQGKPETLQKSGDYVTQLKNHHIDPALLDYLDGHRKFMEENWLEASKVLEGATPGLVRSPELARRAALLLGQCYEQLGDPDRQYTAYRRAVPDDPYDPSWFTASEGVARSLLGLNKLSEALDIYRKLMQRSLGARFIVVRVLIVHNLSLPQARRDWTEVNELLKNPDQLPKTAEVTILRAQALAAQDKRAEAKKLLDDAQESAPKDMPVWLTRASFEASGGKPADALAILDEAAKQVGDRVELRLARIRFLLQSDSKDVTRSLEKAGEGVDKFTPAERQLLARGLAEAYSSLGEHERALKYWEKLSEQRPNDLGVRIRLFDLALLTKDDDAAQVQQQAIRRLEGASGTLWRYARAAWLVSRAQRGEKKTLEEARSLLTEVAAKRPNWSRVPACQAQVALLDGQIDEAIRYDLLAIDQGERSPTVLLETIRLLGERRRYPDIAQVLQKLPEQTPVLKQLNSLVVGVALKTNDKEKALKVAKKAVADDPNNYHNHLILAQAYWFIDNLTDAEASMRQAVKLAEYQLEPRLTLITFLARTKQADKAKLEFAKAREKFPEAKNRLAFAYCYDVLGQQDKAKDLYRAALQNDPHDLPTLRAGAAFFLHTGDVPEAKRLLEAIIRLRQDSPAEIASTRRLLALVLATEGTTYEEKRKVLAELGFLDDSTETKTTESPDDKRMRAILLASQGRRYNRTEAIRIMEDVSKLQPLTTSDQFLLAQLYDSLGNKSKVQTLMLTVLSKEGENPQYLAFWIRKLLVQNEKENAKTWLEQLSKLQPKLWQTIELQARLLHAEEKDRDAVTLLTKFAEEEKNAPLFAIATLLEQIEPKPQKAAERIYEKLVDKIEPMKKPDAILVLAAFLGRNDRLAEALDKCAQVRPQRPEAAVNQAVLILYGTKSSEADWGKVEGWIQEGLTAAKNDIKRRAALQQNLATLYNLQGRFDKAEQTYRQCLDENPKDVLALNNLAWYLATKGKNGEEALPWIQRAIDIAGPLPGLIDTRAIAYLAQGKSDLAVKDLEEIVADKPNGAFLFHLALAQRAANNKTAWHNSFQRATEAPYDLQEKDLHPFEREKFQQMRKEFEL